MVVQIFLAAFASWNEIKVEELKDEFIKLVSNRFA